MIDHQEAEESQRNMGNHQGRNGYSQSQALALRLEAHLLRGEARGGHGGSRPKRSRKIHTPGSFSWQNQTGVRLGKHSRERTTHGHAAFSQNQWVRNARRRALPNAHSPGNAHVFREVAAPERGAHEREDCTSGSADEGIRVKSCSQHPRRE